MTTVVTTASSGPISANGVTALPFDFQAISDSEIRVTRNGIDAPESSYIVTLNDDNTGSITPTSSWGSDQVIIYSEPDYQQLTNFARHGAWYPDQLNKPLDKIARTLIGFRDYLIRTAQANENDSNSTLRADLVATNGASRVSFTPAWGGTRSVENKFKDLPHLYDIINNEADRTTAFDATAALSAALATGEAFVLPKAEVRFSGTIPALVNGAGFIGQGYNSQLVHTSPTADMFLLGNGTNEISGLRFENFRLWSTVNKTAGAAFNARFLSDAEFRRVSMGSLDAYVAAGNVNRMFNGLILNRFAEVNLIGGQALAKNTLVQLQGNADQSFGYEFVVDGNWRGLYAAVGIRQGGGAGGVYFNRGDLSNCGTGVSIDQTLTNTFNREAFFSSDFTIDSCTGTGVIIDQTAVASAQFIFDHTWIAGNGAGGLWIKNANDARVVANIHGYKNTGDAIRYDDPNCYLTVPASAWLDINTGFGVNPTVPSSRLRLGNFPHLANGSGPFNSAFNRFEMEQTGTSRHVQAPSAAWGASYVSSTMTIANGSNAAIAPGSGMVQISSTANGHTAVYLVSGADVVLMSSTGASWVAPTATPAAGQSSIAWDGVSAYRVYNNTGASQVFSVALPAKTRDTA